MSRLADTHRSAVAYARKLAIRDRHENYTRPPGGVIWSAEKHARRQFAYTDQNAIARAYSKAWSAHQEAAR